MKRIAFALILFVLLLGLSSSVVFAQCPNGEDLYCAPSWTPAMQAQKMRLAWLDQTIADHQFVLKDCNIDCIENYNKATLGLLYKFADVNGFPKDKTVLAAIAVNYDWGLQQTDALKRPLVQEDWNKHFAWGMIDLAQKLNVNSPIVIWNGDEMNWCVVEQYDGHCGGKW